MKQLFIQFGLKLLTLFLDHAYQMIKNPNDKKPIRGVSSLENASLNENTQLVKSFLDV